MSEYIDLSQFQEPLALADEPVFDPTASQSGPPPIPEDKEGYICILRFAKDAPAEWWVEKKDNGVTKYLYTNIVAEVLTGKYEGRKVRDFVSTQVNRFDKTTRTNLILRELGTPVTAADVAAMGAHRANAAKFQDAMQTEPTIKIFVQWQAKFLVPGPNDKKVALTTVKDGKEVQLAIRGANKATWPKNDDGSPKANFTLGAVFPEFAGTEYAETPATVEAAIVRFAPNVN